MAVERDVSQKWKIKHTLEIISANESYVSRFWINLGNNEIRGIIKIRCNNRYYGFKIYKLSIKSAWRNNVELVQRDFEHVWSI